MARLSQYPVDIVKIDHGFIHQLGSDPRHTALLAALIAFARELNLTVVAEGIETTHQRDLLLELACPYGQGYLLGLPAPPRPQGARRETQMAR